MAFSKLDGKGIDLSSNVLTSFASTGIDDNATSTAMTIHSSGLVGIGVTSPGVKLDVAGTSNVVAKFTGTNTHGNIQIISAGTTNRSRVQFGDDDLAYSGSVQYLHDSDSMMFATNNGERVRIDSSGNVGIGLTDPAKELEVAGTILASPILYSSNQDEAYLIAGTSGWTGATTNWNTFGFQHRIKTDSSGVPRITIDNSGGEVFCISNAGNVGINTSDPQVYLDLSDATGSSLPTYKGRLRLHVGSNTGNGGLEFHGSSYQSGYGHRINCIDPGGGTPLTFSYRSNSATWTEIMRIGTSGGMAIGTTDVSNIKLLVRGDGTTNSYQAFRVQDSSGSTLQRVDCDGTFLTGLATQSPYNSTSSSAANCYIHTNGKLRRSTSSQRYKTNIEDMTYGLSKVLELRPVTFNSINEEDTGRFAGLIAEEVHDTGMTEFVDYNSSNQPDGLHYANMVSLLVKAIQELEARLAAVESN